MASRRLSLGSATLSVPRWEAPRILINGITRTQSPLDRDLVLRFQDERFQVFLVGHFAMWFGAGVLIPAVQYIWMQRSFWFLVLGGISVLHSVAIVVAIWLAHRKRYAQAIAVVCVGNWIGVLVVVYVSPPTLSVMAVTAMLPAAFAEPYLRWKTGLAYAGMTGVCMIVAGMLARFIPPNDAVRHATQWVETSFVVVGLGITGLNLMAIVWHNAAALRTSQAHLAERAVELAASRTRLSTAADEERRRIERDLHDGAQQHLVALSVLIQLARTADQDRYQPLLTEAAELVDTAIGEIRRLAHGIYPPLLLSGGLTEALPMLASRAAVPVRLDLQGIGRYQSAAEGALYYCCSEALQNAAKHGGPDTTVAIIGRADGDTLTLEIADTGPGFDRTTAGMGLTNMADRLSAIGGQLVIDTGLGRGTRIIATVDIPDPR
ncbi:MAG: sensor histidine kinase [Mycolicibacterium cosmeticum]|nr:sensor histidine kinase [Mycolicibacterium cosmeticum]